MINELMGEERQGLIHWLAYIHGIIMNHGKVYIPSVTYIIIGYNCCSTQKNH